jgi:hypothetical protein
MVDEVLEGTPPPLFVQNVHFCGFAEEFHGFVFRLVSILFHFCSSFVHFCSRFVQFCTVDWKVFCHRLPENTFFGWETGGFWVDFATPGCLGLETVWFWSGF